LSLFFLVVEAILLTAYVPLPLRVQRITIVVFVIPSFALACYVLYVLIVKAKEQVNQRYSMAEKAISNGDAGTPTGTYVEQVALAPLNGAAVVDDVEGDHPHVEGPEAQAHLAVPQDVRPVSSSTYQGGKSVSN